MKDISHNNPIQKRPGGGHPGPHIQIVREKPKNAKKTFKRLISYIGVNKYLLLLLLIIMIFITLLSLASPALQADAIDTITLKDGYLSIDFKHFFIVLGILAATYGLSAVLNYFEGILSAKLSQVTVRNMRRDLFSKIVKLPIKYVDTHQHGDLMSRMTNDVDNVSNTISQSIASFISSILTIIGTVIIMLYFSPILTLVSFIVIPISMLVTVKLASFMRKYFIQQQTLLGNLDGHIEEMVTGYKTVVAFNKEDKAIQQFYQINAELKKYGIRAQVLGGIMGPLMGVIGNLSYLLIAAAGGYLTLKGSITIGIIQAFLIYSKQFSRPINELANQYAQIQTAIAGAERIFEVMDTPSEIDNGTTAVDNLKGDISFNDVTFSYKPGEIVLKNLNLKIEAGQKIAIVGATGSGKTTIVNLLTRFYDVQSGSICIDGINIQDIPKAELRKNIAIVLQDTVLFSDTISKNICYGKLDATEEEIIKAAKIARCDEFIERLPEGYNTILSQSGTNLSQGQQQLLSIARAVLADPKILILDEATANIDTNTEMYIQEAMINLMKNRTSIIIAHRLSTIRDADKIVVIENGRVVESGNHKELLEKKSYYYRLYQKQFAGIAT